MSIAEKIQNLRKGTYDSVLQKIYVDRERIPAEKERLEQAMNSFRELFGDQEIEVFSAPGRSEVCGNHTDHQLGIVLATSVNIDTIAVASARNDGKVVLKSEGYPQLELDLADLSVQPSEEGSTAALIRGVACGTSKRGFSIGGFNAYCTSEVLSGSGLSSSAAFETLIGTIFSGLYNNGKINSVMIAQIGQEAENIHFGKPSGLMDQMACSVGGLIRIDFKDPKNPVIDQVEVDFETFGHSLCIVDTKGSHADLTGDYAEIPGEMKKVAEFFGKPVLREVDEAEFRKQLPAVRTYAGDRAVLRAIHFFGENKRPDAAVAALRAGDFNSFCQVILASGDSSYKYLQNVYSAHKVQEQSVSVALAVSEQALNGKGASRVHGGGFAGTIQAFVPNELTAEYKKAMEQVFGEGACHVLKIRPVGGVKLF